MINRVNIYFEDDKLRKNLEVYCDEHAKSFSEAVIEFTTAGFSLFQKTGSLNVDLLLEKVGRLDEAKREIDFLRGVVEATLPPIDQQISKPRGQMILGKQVSDARDQKVGEMMTEGKSEPRPRRVIRTKKE